MNCFLTWEEKWSFVVFCWLAKIIAKKFVVSFFTWSADKNGGSVARGKTSSSCSILFPVYLKRRISENICFQIYFSSINFDFLGQMFLVRKRWVHETASSTRINNPSSTKLSYSKWKNAVLNPSKSFLALKKKKKLGKTPSSHIIHSLGGEYCWIVPDGEPVRLLKSPRSVRVYILMYILLV